MRSLPISAARPARDGRFRFGAGWQFDRDTWRLKNPAGDDVELTMNEHAVLLAFINAPQRMLSREHLLQVTGTRSLDGIIHRLCRKLPGIIQTRRGEGYVFSAPVEGV